VITTSYTYDIAGNLTRVTDPNGNQTSYVYDDFGRMLSQTSPVTGTTTYSYDKAGNLVSTTDANSIRASRIGVSNGLWSQPTLTRLSHQPGGDACLLDDSMGTHEAILPWPWVPGQKPDGSVTPLGDCECTKTIIGATVHSFSSVALNVMKRIPCDVNR